MKAIASICCILALVTVSKSSAESDEEERIKAINAKCKNETQRDARPTDSSTMKTEQSPSLEQKCMMGCVMRETGVIANGKFDKGGALKMAEKQYSTKKEEMEKTKKIIDICEKRVGNESDECNLGYKIVTCLAEESEKIGLKPVHSE